MTFQRIERPPKGALLSVNEERNVRIHSDCLDDTAVFIVGLALEADRRRSIAMRNTAIGLTQDYEAGIDLMTEERLAPSLRTSAEATAIGRRNFLSALAITQFLYPTVSIERLIAEADGPGQPDISTDLDDARYLCHAKSEVATELLGEQPPARTAWYEGETVFVRTFQPANPNPDFLEDFQNRRGVPFDTAGQVTLWPQLKTAFAIDGIRGFQS